MQSGAVSDIRQWFSHQVPFSSRALVSVTLISSPIVIFSVAGRKESTIVDTPACCHLSEVYAPKPLLHCVKNASHSQASSAVLNTNAEHWRHHHRIVLTTFVSHHVRQHGVFSVGTNAAWARQFGHRFVLMTDEDVMEQQASFDSRDRYQPSRLVLSTWKPTLLLSVINRIELDWMLWIDADAAIVDFGEDWVVRLIETHVGNASNIDFIFSMSCFAHVSQPSAMNIGVFLMRRSPWSLAFLMAFQSDPRMRVGLAADQDVLGAMYRENFMGIRGRSVLLSPLAMNTDDLIVAHPPRVQPVIHLLGHPNTLRRKVLQETFRGACRGGFDRDSLDPLQSIYVAALTEMLSYEDISTSEHLHHVSVLTRLLVSRGHRDEARSKLQQVVFRHGESWQLLQPGKSRAVNMGKLALFLRKLDRLDEAVSLISLALNDWPPELHEISSSDGIDMEGSTLQLVMASLLNTQNRNSEAILILQRLLPDMTVGLGQAHPEVLQAQLLCAQALGSLGERRQHEASFFHFAAVSSSRRIYGDHSLQTWRAWSHFADWTSQVGFSVDNVIDVKPSGTPPPEVAPAVGSVLQRLGRTKEAVSVLSIAHRKNCESENSVGKGFAQCLDLTLRLARALNSFHDVRFKMEAESLLVEAINARTNQANRQLHRTPQKDDMDLELSVLMELDSLWSSDGRFVENEAVWQAAFRRAEISCGWDCSATMLRAHNVAALKGLHGKPLEAAPLLRKALSGWEKLGHDARKDAVQTERLLAHLACWQAPGALRSQIGHLPFTH